MSASKSSHDDDPDITEGLLEIFTRFSSLAGSKDDPTHMTTGASAKMVDDCLPDYKKYHAKTICEQSIFPLCTESHKKQVFSAKFSK